VNLLARYPRLVEVGISLAILAGSYLGARVVSHVLARLARRMARSATPLDDQLVAALQWLLTYALFMAGAWSALHRLPLPSTWLARLDVALYVLGVLLLALALLRSYGALMNYYILHSAAAAAGGPASEFGPLFSKLGKGLIVLLAAIAVLQHVGVNVASLVVSLGVGSLAVGLAAQDTLANMIAGFTLMLDRPFRIGDRIQLASGDVGDVQTIGMRATQIRTLDESVLVIPNSVLVKERLVNLSRPTSAVAVKLDLSVVYGSDLARVKQILLQAVEANPHAAAEPGATAVVTRFGALSVDLQLSFRVRDYAQAPVARGRVYEELERRLAEADIEIALPVSRVLHEAEPAEDEGAA
jgi:small-conductance mechanosensitive channel